MHKLRVRLMGAGLVGLGLHVPCETTSVLTVAGCNIHRAIT
jgi:hypothetical protein